MKGSKEAALRALREAAQHYRSKPAANYAVKLTEAQIAIATQQPRREVVPHTPGRVPATRHDKAKPPVVKATADQPGAVPWLAPEGECASCDKRRAALQAAMRKRRAHASK